MGRTKIFIKSELNEKLDCLLWLRYSSLVRLLRKVFQHLKNQALLSSALPVLAVKDLSMASSTPPDEVDEVKVVKSIKLTKTHVLKWAKTSWGAGGKMYTNGDILLEHFIKLVLRHEGHKYKDDETWNKIISELNAFVLTNTDLACRIDVKPAAIIGWYEKLVDIICKEVQGWDSKIIRWGCTSFSLDITSMKPSLPEWKQGVIGLAREGLLSEDKKNSSFSIFAIISSISTDTWRFLTDFFAAAVGAVVVALQISQPGPYDEYSNYIISFALMLAFLSRWMQYHDGNYPIFVTIIRQAAYSNVICLRKEYKISIWLTVIAYAATIVVNNIAISYPAYNDATTIAISVTTFLVAFEGDFYIVVKLISDYIYPKNGEKNTDPDPKEVQSSGAVQERTAPNAPVSADITVDNASIIIPVLP